MLSPLGSVITRIHRGTAGPEQTRIIALFAGVLALESADLATVGPVAPQLQAAFGISETQLGLLATGFTFTVALATIPFGVLVDRVTATRILGGRDDGRRRSRTGLSMAALHPGRARRGDRGGIADERVPHLVPPPITGASTASSSAESLSARPSATWPAVR